MLLFDDISYYYYQELTYLRIILYTGSGETLISAMAEVSTRLDPPGVFDFQNPEGWSKWKGRFEQFRLASGLSKSDK